MREVDGFTLIDYIKSSIEILMNMKRQQGRSAAEGKRRRKKLKKQKGKKLR